MNSFACPPTVSFFNAFAHDGLSASVRKVLWPAPPQRRRGRRRNNIPRPPGRDVDLLALEDGDENESDSVDDSHGDSDQSYEPVQSESEERAPDVCSDRTSSADTSSSSDSSRSSFAGDESGLSDADDGNGGGGVTPGGPALVTLKYGGGRLCYYPLTQHFVAWCDMNEHVDLVHGIACRRVRTAKAGKKRAQGRPLGHLLSFLADEDAEDRAAHMARHGYRFEERDERRAEMYGEVAFQDLAEFERKRRRWEGEEPLHNS